MTFESVSSVPLGWRVFKNAAAQIAGRNFIALGRLVVAGIIIRTYGMGRFAEYALVFGVLSIAEWLMDFGTTEVFVREICRQPHEGERLMRIMTALKIIQIPAAVTLLVAILLVLRYPAQIVEAALIGGASMVFYGGVLVYRVLFKANLTIEREVGAELLSVLAMIPMIAFVGAHQWGLNALIGCHFLSRGVFFGVCFLAGKNAYRPSFAGITWRDVTFGFRSSAAIGLVGLLVVVYETLDLVLLSKVSALSELAYYSGAQRLVWPMLMGLTSIGATLYPIVSSYWPRARAQFEEACQRGVDTVAVLAGVAVCSVLASAEFFMSLLGNELAAGASALRVLAILAFVKAITSTVGPVLYVIRAQRYVLQVIVVAVIVKAVALTILAHAFGYMGVAVAALAVELLFAAMPSVYLLNRLSGCRLKWSSCLKVVMITTAAAVAARLFIPQGGLAAAILAPAFYIVLVFLGRIVRLSEMHSLLRWRTS